MNTPTFQKALTAWQMAIKGEKHFPLPPEIQCESAEVFANQCAQLGRAKIEQNKMGFECQFNKGRSGSKRMAWIKSGLYALKIVYDAGKRQQAVTQTSRDAYKTIDFTTQRGQIASIIYEYTVLQGDADITRKEIEVWQNIGCNIVCGRVKELLEMSDENPFDFGGKPYRLQVVGTRLSKCDGASKVPNEGLKWVEESVNNTVETGQIELF